MASDIIDFQGERGRHEALLGREEVMAELDALLLGGASRGWALVKGGPGMGKSALLAEWLKRREDAGLPVPPHHFARRGVEDWDRPEVVKRNLAAQVERLYPELVEPEARSESRLRELLQRVSDNVLKPRQEWLVLVVDGLDEVEGESDGSNPLPRFLPHLLPHGVKVLCASRPTYPYLSWLEARDGVRTIDLDGERWAGSNKKVVRQYWEHVAPRFVPPLTPEFEREVLQRAEGNVLYAVKLAEWLQEQPVEKRRAELLPRGLEALLDESWERLQRLPGELRSMALEGLGVVAAARDALPLSILAAVAGWKELEDRERFLRVARSFLLEEPGHGRGERAWRPFHESFRSFILSKLGEERERAEHRRLAEQLCPWPVEAPDRGFRWSYALRHGVTHWLRAGDGARARRLYTDLGYLEAKFQLAGVLAIEEDLRSAAQACDEPGSECPKALRRAIRAGSHVLRKDPRALPLLVYNHLRSSGWEAARIEDALLFPAGLPALRLRHPVKTDGSEYILEGLQGSGLGCRVTPDGRRVLAASSGGMLKVWDVETGRELASLLDHGQWWSHYAVTLDGRRLVSASSQGLLKLWEVETGRELARLEQHDKQLMGCAVTPDGRHVVSGFEDGMLRAWEVETGRIRTFRMRSGVPVTPCTVTPDGQRVVFISHTGHTERVRVWEVETGRVVLTRMRNFVVPLDGERAVSEADDATLQMWEVATGRMLRTLEGSAHKTSSCFVTSLDGRRVVSASRVGTVTGWEVETGRELASLKGHGDWRDCHAVTPDGRRVISASWDGTLKVWEVEPGEDLVARGYKGRVMNCAVTPDGRRVLSASTNGWQTVRDVETGQVLASLWFSPDESVNGCAVTPDGQRAVSACASGLMRSWDVNLGRELASLEGHRHSVVNGCAITPDGQRVVSASSDETLKVWDLEAGRSLLTLRGHEDWVWGCTVTPDGGRVVSASKDKTLKVWALETGRLLATLRGHAGQVLACAVTPDGRRVVSASDDTTLKVWDLETGRVLVTLEGHTGDVWGCAVLPDGGRVVSASEDKTLKVWNLDSGQCLHTLHGVDGFRRVAATRDVICVGDKVGNVWILETTSSGSKTNPVRTDVPLSSATMSVSFPKPVLEAYRSQSLALFIGSGLSLGRDVKGNFPTWSQLPHRLLDACQRYGSLDEPVIQGRRGLFTGRMRLEVMLADLGSLRTVLERDYQKALNDLFRPADAAPGSAHQAVARLGVRVILTTNYDPLLERVQEAQHRQPYTWKESDLALNDLESGRHVLLKVHGTAERHDTVVMTESEYKEVRSNPTYQAVLGHLLQRYTFLFMGYGMNDPLDLDLVLKWNADAFKSAARRHYALLKDPSDTDRDRYEREYNVRVIPYSDHARLPAILEELQRTADRVS